MSKPEWGKKYACPNCGGKFYDMGRTPIICPSCETLYQFEQPKRRRQKSDKSKEEVESNAASETVGGADLLLEADTEDIPDDETLMESDNDNDESLLISDDDEEDDIVVVDIDTSDD